MSTIAVLVVSQHVDDRLIGQLDLTATTASAISSNSAQHTPQRDQVITQYISTNLGGCTTVGHWAGGNPVGCGVATRGIINDSL
ncbi:Uncharacterized protein HZ326_20698 [Fusarium oxysporum f. sp. albedinis]|nr:Uncharacterized protein HZ326_20698 [Fusarium oxysporum f. sp. albedinis]